MVCRAHFRQIKTLFAIILEHNTPSIGLVRKFKFEKWEYLPRVAGFDGKEYGHLYFGRRVYKEFKEEF